MSFFSIKFTFLGQSQLPKLIIDALKTEKNLTFERKIVLSSEFGYKTQLFSPQCKKTVNVNFTAKILKFRIRNIDKMRHTFNSGGSYAKSYLKPMNSRLFRYRKKIGGNK